MNTLLLLFTLLLVLVHTTFAQSNGENQGVRVVVKAYMQGYWNGTIHIPTPVAVELRSGSALMESSLVSRTTGMLSTTGTISANFTGVASGSYWIVIRHGGYLPTGSATAMNMNSDTTVYYDFTDLATKAANASTIPVIVNGIVYYMLKSGDFNGDRANNPLDIPTFIAGYSKTNALTVPPVELFSDIDTNFGKALVLDGENDYVVVPHSNSLNLSASSFTIEAWVKPSNRVYYKWIIGKATSNSSLDYLLGFDLYGRFRFITRSLANDLRGSFPQWDQWYHVAGVQDVENNMVYLYVNGQLDASATLQGVPNANTGNVLIGVRTHTNNINILAEYLDGTVDDIRIWKKARTQAEILQDYHHPIQGNETMLEAYWNFDEEQGSTVYDVTEHGHDGTFGQGTMPTRTISTVPTE